MKEVLNLFSQAYIKFLKLNLFGTIFPILAASAKLYEI